MKCPFCSNPDTRVIDSRNSDNHSIRRRRECEKCGKRFTTYENVESINLKVVKKNGSVEIFNSDKVRAGIIKACEKRPVTEAQINSIIKKIEVLAGKNGKISSKKIGDMVVKGLEKIDNVAYIRFASVYKNFKDINSFKEELLKLNKK